MRTLLAAVLILSLAFVTTPAFAGKKKPVPNNDPRIVEVNALSITLSVGKSGDDHQTYKISKETKITLNGSPITADNLRAGMIAIIKASDADAGTAASIDAKDAPKQ
jgi:hypothetical protein